MKKLLLLSIVALIGCTKTEDGVAPERNVKFEVECWNCEITYFNGTETKITGWFGVFEHEFKSSGNNYIWVKARSTDMMPRNFVKIYLNKVEVASDTCYNYGCTSEALYMVK